MQKTVITFGSFDLVHTWHEYYLSEAKKYGDYLITIIASNANIKKIKGSTPLYDEETRREHIIGLNIADEVIIGDTKDPLKYIRFLQPDIICLGYDQRSPFVTLLEDYIQNLPDYSPEIVRIPWFNTETEKSSIIKQKKTLP